MKQEKKQADTLRTSSTAEYFSKNLQQVGFSSPTKAVLTTLKEAVDNALDACEEAHILPEVWVEIEKKGPGSLKNTDQVVIRVEDNGPGIESDLLGKVFGEYLASSKFGRGKCSRGQQGIGISAATTWAQLTSARGARVISKTKSMRKAVRATIDVGIKENKGILKQRETFDWGKNHGTWVEFVLDGRIQLNGEAGLLTYLTGTALVNPHLTLNLKLLDQPVQVFKRLSETVPVIPEATEPHPHTLKLGEFIQHAHLYGNVQVASWLKKGFSRVHEPVLTALRALLPKGFLERQLQQLQDKDFKLLYGSLQNTTLMAPSTHSVLSIGEEGFAKSMTRLGAIDFFSVVSRKPTIADFKPVQVEVGIARLLNKPQGEESSQVLRFANRVPLQFDKSSCAIYQAIQSVNWKSYGLVQPRQGLPQGPFVIAVSVVSPFIKFKNASKETIDASEDLVEEIRRALMQAGQRLSKHIRREVRAQELEDKIRHIEQFCPILVEGLCRLTGAPDERRKKAEQGLLKILGRETDKAQTDLERAEDALNQRKHS